MAQNVARQKEVTTREVASIRFGMYTDEEVRKLSVKKITAPLTFTNNGHIVPDGLYDAAMGPPDYVSRCTTCGLKHDMCPGHFGHIELPVAVYNPSVFGTLYKLLKHTCLNCHQFKMGRKEMSKFLVKLSCLSRGDLVAASLIHTSGAGPRASALEQLMGLSASANKKGSSKTGSSKGGKQVVDSEEEEEAAAAAAAKGLGLDGDLGTGLGAYEAAYGEHGTKRLQQLPLTCHIQDAMRIAVAEFFTRMPSTKCQNCGCTNPSIRKQGSTKLFKQYTRKALLQNSMRGINVAALVGSGSRAAANEVGDVIRQAEEAAAAVAAAAGKKRKRSGDSAAEDAQQLQQQQHEGEQAKKKAAVAAAAGGLGVAGFQQKQQNGAKADDLEENLEDVDEERQQQQQPLGKPAAGSKGGKSQAAEAAAAAHLGKQFSIDAKTKPLYMDPEEVEHHMSQLCHNESGILRHIYGGAQFSMHGGVGSMQRRGQESVRRAAQKDPARLYKSFFIRALAVPPNRFRPPSTMGDTKYEHTQNITMQNIIQACLAVNSIESELKQRWDMQDADAAASGLTAAQRAEIQRQRNIDALQRFTSGWLRLQNEVNALIDSTAADNTEQGGVRQQLEKKEGLFRKNMMGKRVNFAARSVISPDPYIGAGEIGVPPYFATRLSFPEAVTPHNVKQLMQMVINGPHEHPGALAVEDASGDYIVLAKVDRKKREGLAKQLLNPYLKPSGGRGSRSSSGAATSKRGKVVHRHLVDGDLMLTNRQPTLHKPGLMAHRARVLKGERTIRMHYANCSTFNADFDGDEINLHLPQDHLGRAEGYNIVHADRQFIVPTDGKPIRGLIQDHVGGGVLITCRDSFFTKAEFGQLLFNACTPWRPGGTPSVEIKIPLPALLKPRRLWTGKQLLSSVVAHFSRGRPPITFSTGSKVPLSYWGQNSDEGSFLFHKGHLLTGCLDKAQFGKFGLVHAMQELYGDEVAGAMLNALSRLLTCYLQGRGFTCGMDDLLLVPTAEAARTRILAKADPTALAASAEVVKSKLVTANAIAKSQLKHSKLAHADDAALLAQRSRSKLAGLLAAERLIVSKQLEQHYCTNGAATGAVHDAKVTGVMHPLASEVIKACIPTGQAKPFPANCMSLMTVSGAKGSTVNFSQISCLLGQQELEGRRVPRTASGKTLPCFRAYDGGARAGGFVGDRFLTGLRPQEYYFHCMAGREGLVDTTVKTSRSGYLQRCLVKNLEALRVTYDGTVRDVCDGSIVQLYYGDDGLDVTKVSYMKQTAFLAANAASAARQLGLTQGSVAGDEEGLTSQGLNPNTAVEQQDAAAAVAARSSSKHNKQQQLQVLLQGRLREFGLLGPQQAEVAAALQARSQMVSAAAGGDEAAQKQLMDDVPLMARYFPSVLGVTSESFADTLERFCADPSQHLLMTQETATAAAAAAAADTALALLPAAADGSSKKEVKKAAKKRRELLSSLVSKQVLASDSKLAQMAAEDFRSLMQLKFMSALASPGEAVGVIAAQSVGEPSTQMTLNTFHMAGRGEANVTLGIPRLREILMTAAPRIKTPTMTMPLRASCSDADAQLLASRMRKLKLAECLRGLKTWERPAVATPHMVTGSKWGKAYDIHLRFHELSLYPKDAELTWQKLEDALLKGFVPQLKAALKKQLKKQGVSISSMAVSAVETSGGGGGGDDDDNDDGEGGEGAAASSRGVAKAARQHEDQDQADDDDKPEEAAEDEEADEELREGKLQFRGGRGEAATYDGPDEEDAAAEAEIDAELRHRLGEDDGDNDGNADADGQRRQQQQQHSETAEGDQSDSDDGEDDDGGKNDTSAARSRLQAAAAAAVAKRKGGAKGAAAAAAPAAAAGRGSSRARTTKTVGDDLIKARVVEIKGRMQCEVRVVLPMTAPKVLMLELAEEVAVNALVNHIPGIQAVHLLEPEKADEPRRLQTEGINFQGIWEQQRLIDVDRIACNDVHAMLTTYGVEAARATILKEVQAVFGAYGIGVDPRHLGLIADFMTHQGGYKACNRIGIDSETSPLLKMSFETAAKFLMDAALSGGGDTLTSPAARIVVGQVTEVGTGCCKVLHALE